MGHDQGDARLYGLFDSHVADRDRERLANNSEEKDFSVMHTGYRIDRLQWVGTGP